MLIFCDDGEGGTGNYPWTEAISIGHATSPQDGSYTISESSASALYVKKVLAAAYTELFVSVFVKLTSSINSRMLTWYTGATELGSVRWNATNKHFEIYTSTGTLQTTGTVSQQAVPQGGGWFNLNIRILLHASTGEIAVRHEGATTADATFTGNTLPSGSNMDGMLLGAISGSTSPVYDNFWVNDTSGAQNNSWPGVVRCSTQFPTGKSATNDAWTADSGTNKYDRINEQPASGNNYIYSETNAQKQGFTFAAPAFSGTIKALVINDLARKTSAGTFKQGVRIAGTDYPSGTKTPKTSLTRESMHQHYLELNPNTSAAWTTSENPETYLEKTA